MPEALILKTSTVAGSIEGDKPSLHVAYIDDADAQFIAEATEIPESDPTLAEVLVHTGKISQLVPLSAEQFSQDGTASQIAQSVSRALVKRADQAYLAQVAPTPPAVHPPAGLINIDGLTEGNDLVGDLDSLVDLIAELEAEGSTPSHIIVDRPKATTSSGISTPSSISSPNSKPKAPRLRTSSSTRSAGHRSANSKPAPPITPASWAQAPPTPSPCCSRCPSS
ncbi:hypothetical protein [Mycolicibacterium gilvum]|uniref:hypothetical protein n=1 Tax=Mycolicibacterium gilvum TaxID=1804 RepID=UPI0021F2EE10|nr:hypothetical protein [Mycolicibacterium gilvum]